MALRKRQRVYNETPEKRMKDLQENRRQQAERRARKRNQLEQDGDQLEEDQQEEHLGHHQDEAGKTCLI
jgi:hypothetical protein